jgi:hypothetical protein
MLLHLLLIPSLTFSAYYLYYYMHGWMLSFHALESVLVQQEINLMFVNI